MHVICVNIRGYLKCELGFVGSLNPNDWCGSVIPAENFETVNLSSLEPYVAQATKVARNKGASVKS